MSVEDDWHLLIYGGVAELRTPRREIMEVRLDIPDRQFRTLKDVARAFDLTRTQVDDHVRLGLRAVGISPKIAWGMTFKEVDDLWDPPPPDPDAARREQLCDQLLEAVSALPERERLIVETRWGLLSDSPQPPEEVGRYFGLTPNRVQQLERRAASTIVSVLRWTPTQLEEAVVAVRGRWSSEG